ncbi:hypothetical protein [Enterococcus caccae]|uniref:Uncharacterized protein n=1 Tax=Enterococcus caccae ATCC BAA-1240 TaxID=1158612 RepID=R3TU52_9ENTE|nr:hypothetical protein [Enterococcus caccae]EOL45094.1 hypothetical protein UC7_01900 [Enterococcus caccae ATCC BAA-1240]EOT58501.1 hypothetical protein I580_02672 [Enterococcus caccae ATCC BAA-1240]OJG27170.1 hypothetical protein RU98_GL002950 [Enterococcus caccae]
MRRYIWLGDSKYGGSVYWDKKRDVAVRDGSSKVSAKKSKSNKYLIVGLFVCLIIVRVITSFFKMKFISNEINNISMIVFTIFFATTLTLFINRMMYGNSQEYTDTNLEDAMHAIRSTGYLKNPLIFMLLDKKLHYMVLVLVLLFSFIGLSETIPNLNSLREFFRIPFMILFISIPVYMVYLVNFKKDNRLKL